MASAKSGNSLGLARVIEPGFVGEIRDLDISQPLSASTERAVRAAWYSHPVLIFRGQSLTPEALERFGRVFGNPEPEPSVLQEYLHDGAHAVSYVGNIRPDGTPYPFGNTRATAWHSDQSYMAKPVAAGILHALQIPTDGGGTMFCNMYAAYAALPEEIKASLADRIGLHYYNGGPAGASGGPPLDPDKHEGDWKVIRHPMVRVHPETERPALYVNPIHTFGIEGLDEGEAKPLLERLVDEAASPEHVYYHRWQVGDVVVWDQRCLMHRSAADYPAEQNRLLMRVKIAGTLTHPAS